MASSLWVSSFTAVNRLNVLRREYPDHRHARYDVFTDQISIPLQFAKSVVVQTIELVFTWNIKLITKLHLLIVAHLEFFFCFFEGGSERLVYSV